MVVILVVASAKSASVDTIPNAVRSQLSTKFSSALRLPNANGFPDF